MIEEAVEVAVANGMASLKTGLYGIMMLFTAVVVWPYVITEKNYVYMPYYDEFTADYLSARYPYYYPTSEANKMLSVAIGICGVLILFANFISPDITDYTLHVVAHVVPGWILHSYFCRHKINRHTSLSKLRHINKLNMYSRWKVVLLWLFVAVSPCIGLFLGENVWYEISIVFYLLAALSLGSDVFTWLNLLRPYHLLVLAFSGVLFGLYFCGGYYTLFYWALGMILLKCFEYRVRFKDPTGGDLCEQWGFMDPYRSKMEKEKLDKICRRQAEAWWQNKGKPCWRFVVSTPDSSTRYPCAIYYAADRKLMEEELNLRNKVVLRVDQYPDLRTAFRSTSYDESVWDYL